MCVSLPRLSSVCRASSQSELQECKALLAKLDDEDVEAVMEAVDTFEKRIGPLLQRDDAAQSKSSEAAAKPASKAASAPKPKKRPADGASDGKPAKGREKLVPDNLVPALVNHIRNNARLGMKEICTSFVSEHDGEKLSVRQVEFKVKDLAEKRKGAFVITAAGYAQPDSASSTTKARQHAARDVLGHAA